MRSLLLVALALAPVAVSQTQLPLPAFGSTFASTTLTRGFYFQTPVAITITGLRVPDEGAAGVQNVEVSALAGVPATFPATSSGGQVFYATNVPSNHIIPCNLQFAAGAWIGIMGACGTTTMNSSYGNPATAFSTSIAGNPVTLTRFITQTNLNTAGGQLYSGDTGAIGRVEVYYNEPPLPTPTALPAFGSTFSSSTTRGFSFQTPVPIIIRGLRVPDEFRDGTQNVEVKRLSVQPPAYPTTVTGGEVFYANNVPSYQIIPCYLPFQAGDWIGVLGACGTTTMRNSYGTPAGQFASSIGGNPVTLTRMGTQTNLNTTSGQPYWTEAGGSIARIEVYYELATGVASATTYGLGCNRASRAFYELFSSPATFDLTGTAFTVTPNAGRYVATPTGAFVPPPGGATTVILGDDSEAAVPLASPFPYIGGSTASLMVCSNGFVSVAGGNGTGFTPSVGTWLSSPQLRFGDWHDFNPAATGSGLVKFHQAGVVSYVTWDGVFNFGVAASPNTWQLQFNRASGAVTYAWQAMTLSGNRHLVGLARTGPCANAGSIDISAAFPAGFQTDLVDVYPLSFNASARPVVGTNISLNTGSITAGSIFGADLLGLSPDNTPLGPLGAPTCTGYVNSLATNVWFVGGATNSSAFVVPNNPYLLGLHIFGQSATYTPGANALNVLFSNGLDLYVDLQ